MNFYYDIHNILKISSNFEYFPKYFKTKRTSNPDITIREGNFRFNKKKYEKLGLKFYGGNKKLFLEYLFYGTRIQKLLLENLDKKPKLYFTKITNKLFGLSDLILLLLEIKLLQKGYTLIHAGAVSKNEKGYLIPAWSEMGKSSTVFALSKRNFKILGDDKIILSKDGTIYSFPMKCGIFLHTKNITGLSLPITRRIKIYLRFLISQIPPLYLYMDPSERIDLSDFAEIKDKAKLKKTYFLEHGNNVKKIDKKTAINKIVATTLHSLFSTITTKEIFLAYCYLNNFNPNFVEENMKKILRKSLRRTGFFIIKSKKKDYFKFIGK